MTNEKFIEACELERDIRNANDYLDNIKYLFKHIGLGIRFRVTESCDGKGVSLDEEDIDLLFSFLTKLRVKAETRLQILDEKFREL